MPTAVTDPAGRVWHYSYDGSSRLTGIRRPGSSANDVSIGYNGSDEVQSIGRLGLSWTYAYDYNGASQRQTVTTTNPDGAHRSMAADLAIAEPYSATDELGATTSYIFDVQGRLSNVSYLEGNGAQISYDARGNVTQVLRAPKYGQNGGQTIVTTAQYESGCSNPKTCNQPQWTRDANGNQTDYSYDPTHGGVTAVTAPAGLNGVRPQQRYGYSVYTGYFGGTVWKQTSSSACRTAAAGSCAGTADEVVTGTGYGTLSANNLLPVSATKRAGDSGVSATVSIGYDAIGNVVSTTDPVGTVTQYGYDADRERTSVLTADPDGAGPLKRRGVTYHYGDNGINDSVTVGTTDANGGSFTPLRFVVGEYDTAGRLVLNKVVGADGVTYSMTHYGYDPVNRLMCTAVRMNPASFGDRPGACDLGVQGGAGPDRITLTRYDATGRVQVVTEGLGTSTQANVTTTGYTVNGQVASVTDANGNVTGYTYDGFDRLVETHYPNPGGGGPSAADYEGLAYDAKGEVTLRRLRDGHTISYGYDALGRMANDSPAGERGVAYGWDLLGELTEAAYDGLGGGDAVRMDYDALGRLRSSTTSMAGAGRTVSYGYDAAGRRTSITHPDGTSFSIDHDALGETTRAWWWTAATGTVPFMAVTLDDLGRRADINRASSHTGYGLDLGNRLTAQNQRFAGGSGNTSVALAYNAAGQITGRSEANDGYAWPGAVTVDRDYGVDGLNRYTSDDLARMTDGAIKQYIEAILEIE